MHTTRCKQHCTSTLRTELIYSSWVVHGRKPRVGETPSQVPKPSHWPQEPNSDDEGDDDDDA
jgi:hypothetical protein